jgi:hypothetical protein
LITCLNSSGVGVQVGTIGTITNATNGMAAVGGISNTNITTCGTGLQVVGSSSADVQSMTGAAGTTGFSVLLGGLVSFAKAGVTMTAGTNEINEDSGSLTGNFSDVTAGSCLGTTAQSSRVCGR